MSTVQEVIVSQILGIKANIDNVIKMALPILDVEGYAVCPDCDSHVNCGSMRANPQKFNEGGTEMQTSQL